MFSVASFIVGLPGETLQENVESLRLAIKAGPDLAQFIPFYPFPGITITKDFQSKDPDPKSVAMTEQLILSFYKNEEVLKRLEQAASMGGLRAILAQGTIDKYVIPGSRA